MCLCIGGRTLTSCRVLEGQSREGARLSREPGVGHNSAAQHCVSFVKLVCLLSCFQQLTPLAARAERLTNRRPWDSRSTDQRMQKTMAIPRPSVILLATLAIQLAGECRHADADAAKRSEQHILRSRCGFLGATIVTLAPHEQMPLILRQPTALALS